MAIDLSRVAAKALETALDDGGSSRRKGHTMRNLAAGAALAVGARAAVSNTPGKVTMLRHLPGLAHLRDIPDRVRDRMADAGWLDDEPDVDDELEPEAAFDDDEDFEDDPEAEGDEDFDDEDEELDDDEDEPESEADDDFDDEEPEDDEDEESEQPELEIESEDDEDLHPEDRPPKPPRSKAKTRR